MLSLAMYLLTVFPYVYNTWCGNFLSLSFQIHFSGLTGKEENRYCKGKEALL